MLIRRRCVQKGNLKIRRALFTVSDKAGIVELAQALYASGTEIVATGKTGTILKENGIPVRPIEELSGSPEAFQGRMKTLSFPVCSGILFRRGDASDEADLKRLKIEPIDCVVVNFYPFEEAARRPGITREGLIEEIDIGGPTLVRAAAKNSEHVLTLTDPAQYREVIADLKQSQTVSRQTIDRVTAQAWNLVRNYDEAIAQKFGTQIKRVLRYGENPHQCAVLEFEADSPIGWDEKLTPQELSYNNILDLSSAYALASDLKALEPNSSTVVIVKHNNPCGVATIPGKGTGVQKQALLRAWEGDPVSAFGGVLVFSDPIEQDTAEWLSEHFVELVAAPGLKADSSALALILAKRKNLKAVAIHRYGELPKTMVASVPGGRLVQSPDQGMDEELKSVTQKSFGSETMQLSRFGIAVCRALKSNAIALVREIPEMPGAWQLIGAGQGQPNRIEALKALAVPRALSVLKGDVGALSKAVMVSDAFFPFRDTVDEAFRAGIRFIVQPGGSIKDSESIQACDEQGIAMAFTGVRHFKH